MGRHVGSGHTGWKESKETSGIQPCVEAIANIGRCCVGDVSSIRNASGSNDTTADL